MMDETKAKLFAKMAQVMGALNRIPKRGRNDFHRYDYVTDADVLDAVRHAMAEANLAFFFSAGDIERRNAGTTKRGEPKVVTTVDLALTFCDGETGETHTIETMGEAMDAEDKGYNKALTAGVKYGLLKTFLVSTGEDDPDEGAVEQPAQQPTAKAEAKPTPHWIENDKVRKRFWAWAHNDLSLSDEQVHEALACEHVKDYPGTMAEAKAQIEGWVNTHAKAEQETATEELFNL